MSSTASSTTPYKGLSPFSEEDAPFFCGRDGISDIVSANLMSSRLTVIYGPSGVGKSSLLGAGVVNRLKRVARANLSKTGYPGVAIVLLDKWDAGIDPLESMASGAQKALARALDETGFTLPAASASLIESLEALPEEPRVELLFILDQFEQYFLNHLGETGEGTFASEFPRLVNSPALRVNALISIRDDFYTKLDVFKDLSNLFDCSIKIERLNREEAGRAIREPVDQYNRFFARGSKRIVVEDELVEEVLNQVIALRDPWDEDGQEDTSIPADRVGEEPLIEATYLQLVMEALWNKDAVSSSRLRLETLENLGGAKRIVKDHLLSVLDSLSENQREAAGSLFTHLVTPSLTKIAYPVYDLVETGEIDRDTLNRVLIKLSERRILCIVRSQTKEGNPLYEITHDVLAKPIQEWRRNREVEDQRRLAERERARAEEQRQIARRMRFLAISAAVLLILAVILGAAALIKKAEAERSERVAQEANLRAMASSERYREEVNRGVTIDILNSALYQTVSAEGLPYVKGIIETKLALYRKQNSRTGMGLSLHHLGFIYSLEGEAAAEKGDSETASERYRQSETLYVDALRTLTSELGADHYYLANVLHDLGALYYARAEFGSAEEPLSNALEIRRQAVGLDKRYLLDLIVNLAITYDTLGQYRKAEALYQNALQILQDISHSDPLRVANTKEALAELYFREERYEEAAPLLEQALDSEEKSVHPDSSRLLSYLSWLSRVYRKQGKDAQAKSLFERTANLKEPHDAYDYLYLGRLNSDDGRYVAAERFLKRAIMLFEKSVGKTDRINLSFGYCALASVYYNQDKLPEAEALFNQALKIQEASLGAENPQLTETLQGYAALLHKANREADAERVESRVAELRKMIGEAARRNGPPNR